MTIWEGSNPWILLHNTFSLSSKRNVVWYCVIHIEVCSLHLPAMSSTSQHPSIKYFWHIVIKPLNWEHPGIPTATQNSRRFAISLVDFAEMHTSPRSWLNASFLYFDSGEIATILLNYVIDLISATYPWCTYICELLVTLSPHESNKLGVLLPWVGDTRFEAWMKLEANL